jgi:hypothetical protein
MWDYNMSQKTPRYLRYSRKGTATAQASPCPASWSSDVCLMQIVPPAAQAPPLPLSSRPLKTSPHSPGAARHFPTPGEGLSYRKGAAPCSRSSCRHPLSRTRSAPLPDRAARAAKTAFALWRAASILFVPARGWGRAQQSIIRAHMHPRRIRPLFQGLGLSILLGGNALLARRIQIALVGAVPGDRSIVVVGGDLWFVWVSFHSMSARTSRMRRSWSRTVLPQKRLQVCEWLGRRPCE